MEYVAAMSAANAGTDKKVRRTIAIAIDTITALRE
jgi:hypothetical protein